MASTAPIHEAVLGRGQQEFVDRPAADGMAGFSARVLAFAAILYAWLLSRGSLDPFGAEPFGLVFNSMLDHMLRGRWDVDPAAIGYEAFIRDGRTYSYFGPFPALLRLPLLFVPGWQSLHVERLSCWLATILGAAGQIAALNTTFARVTLPARQRLAPPLIVASALSGAPMLLSWKGALIYHEAILWAWALAMVFVAVALPIVQRTGRAAGPRLCVLSVCAGLCVLTRASTGAGLCLATGLLIVQHLVVNRHARGKGVGAICASASVLGAFLVAAAVVNWGRWGNPFAFADLRLQTILIEAFPDRLARLQRYALFDWRRLDIGALYYLLPVWTDQLDRLVPLTDRLRDLYDALELPASSLLVTDPAWCLLAALGVVTLARRRGTAGEALLAAGLSLAPALMLAAWYLAFRYRVEFAPLLLVLACTGLRDCMPRFQPGRDRAVVPCLWLLCLLQVGGAAAAGWRYAELPFGPAPGHTALDLECALSAGLCTSYSDAASAEPAGPVTGQ